MTVFGWVADRPEPPPQWDLRRAGWTLGRSRAAGQVCLVEAASGAARAALREESDRSRLLLLGVAKGRERARWLEAGCGEALAADVGLAELDQRARRIAAAREILPRRRELGSVTLDLLHRDARAGGRWLALHPREFELLWRLAERPGERVSRARLLREVWRLDFDPGTNSVEVHISRLRTKLAAAGINGLVETDPQGGYRIAPARPATETALAERLDQRLCA